MPAVPLRRTPFGVGEVRVQIVVEGGRRFGRAVRSFAWLVGSLAVVLGCWQPCAVVGLFVELGGLPCSVPWR